MREVISPTGQPEWLCETVAGLVGNSKWRVFLEGKKYAIIVRAGHSSYLNRGSGTQYFPTEYVMVQKGANYWHGIFDVVHKGRMNKAKRADLEKLLEAKHKS